MNYIVSTMSEEDKSLFLETMNSLEGVTPIKKRVRQPNHDPGKQKIASRALLKKIKRKQSRLTHDDEPGITKTELDNSSKVSAFESLSYSQPGVRTQELSRLKKGNFKIEAVLDLHGFILSDAEQEIDDFIALCFAKQQRHIRIIHGKGYNSSEQYPILKNLVNQTLRQLNEVIAFSSTPEKDGGVGAVNILLKAQ